MTAHSISDRHQELRSRVPSNLAWLFFGKGVAVLDSVIIGAIVARYLGPSQLGILSYAASLLAIALPFLTFGFDRILVRDFVQAPNRRDADFWLAVIFRLVLVCVVAAGGAALLHSGTIEFSSPQEYRVLLITLLGLLAVPLSVPVLLLESMVLSKWNVWVTNLWVLLAALIRGVLVFCSAPLEAFAVTQVLFSIGVGLSLFAVLAKLGQLPTLCMPKISRLRELVAECWPLAISGIAVTLYMNADLSMLRWLKTPEEAGTYSVAASMSALWYFIPVSLQSSLFPTLSLRHKQDAEAFRNEYQSFLNLIAIVTWCSLGIAYFVMPIFILMLFGEGYRLSCEVFKIHACSLPFVFIGVAIQPLVDLGRFQRPLLAVLLIGMSVNLGLNAWLIPSFGGFGAAWATVIGYAISSLGICLTPKGRPLAMMLVRSFFLCPLTSIHRALRRG
ncbi:flippase [Stieleria sp. JC731]|uniref:flippase n=1 Tax=Pirellulaceae TaxID=2691357 RepID=UPI001E421336|nr:flippase [Stieleria sp. JC731]MCC9599038.1 flippase [Stieleria sp. JC731]